jgi:hypothetical protein
MMKNLVLSLVLGMVLGFAIMAACVGITQCASQHTEVAQP